MFNKVRGLDVIRRFDYILLTLVLILTAVGFLVLRSATATMNTGASIIKMQLIAIVLGVIIGIVLSLIDYQYFKPYGVFIYIIAIVLLIYVIPYGYGRELFGSNSWIKLPNGSTFQPAEIAKLAYVMVVPALLAKLKEEFDIKILILTIISSVLPIILILMQPEFGTAVVFSISLLMMLFIYGIKFKWFAIGVGVLISMIPVIWLFLKEYQKTRIITLLNPSSAKADNYQIAKAKMAIGSGQLTGQGLFNGNLTQNGSTGLPIKDTDFIFSVAGEELGFIGVVIIVGLLFLIIARIIYIAATSDDLYGKFIASGIVGILMFHFIENVGMNVGVLPISGIPLPFVSGGGSAMLINYALIGLVLSISMRRRRN